jgi:hypothetical protein
VPVHQIPDYFESVEAWLCKRFSALQWWKVYDLVEFVVQEVGSRRWFPGNPRALAEIANAILAEEMSAYRFLAGTLAPISSSSEIAAIEDSVAAAEAAGLEGVQIHIRSAVEKLGRKPTPEYRNSIKESISAVESAARQIGDADSLRMHWPRSTKR